MFGLLAVVDVLCLVVVGRYCGRGFALVSLLVCVLLMYFDWFWFAGFAVYVLGWVVLWGLLVIPTLVWFRVGVVFVRLCICWYCLLCE